ncbi:MAG: NACHT domain-containing protein [Cyanobacteria bacterium P01_G01_bin.54]
MSRTTITKFFNQEPVGESSFRKICKALGLLNWEEVSSVEHPSSSSNDQPLSQAQFDKDFIERVREHCRQRILKQHSRMRLISGQKIGVDQLYVDVWLLEKPERRHFNTPESLLENFDIEKDRLALGKRIQRNPGFEIAKNNPKLIILGKPGSGKTTFLKHLAVSWCNSEFQSDKIAVLIELREIQDNVWHLMDILDKELGFSNWKNAQEYLQEIKEAERLLSILKNASEESDFKKASEEGVIKEDFLKEGIKSNLEKLKECRSSIKVLLEQKKLLILMDGLDEVSTHDLRYLIQNQVTEIAREYPGNRFIMTCRTQVMEKVLSILDPVEIADFNSSQVKKFVLNWFITNGKSELEALKRWEMIQCAIVEQPDLKEVSATPVLLNLVCLVLQEQEEMPKNRVWLYRKGIKLLLSRWNEDKDIKGWEIGADFYRQLSVEDKEKLLIEIAARKFENPKNFILFEQDELAKHITQELRLANVQQGSNVLKSIEAQHGLLIERADELWSFSHLTFQEYFTVQWLTHLSPQQLAEKISDQQWRNVVEQLVKSQQPIDYLFRLIKQAIDQSITQDFTFQSFLIWLLKKSNSLQTSYKSVAVRAFYYSLTSDCAIDLDLDFNLDLTFDLDIVFNFDLKLVLARNLDSSLDHALNFDFDLNPDLDCPLNLNSNLSLDRAMECTRARANARAHVLDHNPGQARTLNLARAYALNLDRALDFAIKHACDLNLLSDFTDHLHQLKNKLPTSNSSEEVQSWWLSHGNRWIERLQQVMTKYRNMGHNWHFTQEQQQQLRRYYRANIFLTNLMKIEGAITEGCRTEIEENLLLPWAELQRRQPHLYGELESL